MHSQYTTRVTVDDLGLEANGLSDSPEMSSTGRFVAFNSFADNLVSGDTNGARDAFVHDRETGRTVRVSVDSSMLQGNADSYNVDISADGRFVTFASDATNLVPGTPTA